MPIVKGMRKCDLLSAVWRRGQDRFGKGSITHAQVETIYNIICEVISEELRAGGGCPLVGIGRLQATDVASRHIRNPRNGEMIFVPAGKRIRYIPSKRFIGVFR